jgi:uncharacterized protein
MAAIRRYVPGKFCWTVLGTKDTAGAKKFYRGVFGWKVVDFPMGPGDAKYSMLRVKGKDACALYPMSGDQRKMKAPPFWLPYISVANVDSTVKKARSAGGKVAMAPMDVMDKGRMAIIMDPTGAGFAIWQAGTHRGAGLDDTTGTVCWHDLSTSKPSASAKFYSKVFGWKTADLDFDGNSYHLFKLGKRGICGMWPEQMKKLPPCWVTYWQVSNCARSVAKAKRLGGRALLDTIEVPDTCRFALLKDPQGAPFGILQPL